MRLLAIDPGSAKLGIAVFENEDLLYCDRMEPDSKYTGFVDKLDDKLSKIYLELLRIIHKYEVTNACWEITPNIAGMGNYKDMIISVGALVKALAFQHELSWQRVAANTSKKLVTGNHKASKIDVRNKVIELYPNIQKDFNLKLGQYDAYDAVLIGRASMIRGIWNRPTKTNLTGRDW